MGLSDAQKCSGSAHSLCIHCAPARWHRLCRQAFVHSHAGNPLVIKKAVCMHEEDAGILWKHMEYRDGTAEVRRSRKLVISFIATVVNYGGALLPLGSAAPPFA